MYNQDLKNKWHDDPRNWKLGIFYFNKDDKRIVVSKRLNIFGWTINFANPLSYAILVGLIALIVYLRVHQIKTVYNFS